MMGTERRSLVMSEAEKRMTAYHEGGHALCAMHEPECDPVHKATIIPRGRALGLVMSLPEGDRYSKSKSKLLAELTMAMGGRAAEEIIFGPDKVSNGAAGDIKMATDQARRMITEWGMSDKLGMIAYGDNSQEVFLGHSVTQNKNVSEATAREIDGEIKDIIDRAYAKARRILTENVEELHRLARGLLEHETLSGDEIRTVLRGEPVIRKVVDEPAPESRRASVPTAGRPAARPRRQGALARRRSRADRKHKDETGEASTAVPFQHWAGLSLDRPRVMGVLNITPDSFSDAGDFLDPGQAIAAGLAMAAAGADIIDVGGESTRPQSKPTSQAAEKNRILPVIRGLAAAGLRVSVDTRHAATMAAALDAGAAIVNDVYALGFDPAAAPLVAARGCPVVLMHMRGTPTDMYARARYDDVAADVTRELGHRIEAAARAGIARDRIVIDPGIGFAKTAEQSLELLRRLPELGSLGRPILVGVSRKSFLGAVTGEDNPQRRLPASLAAGLFALSRGAWILRVHDVPETLQAIRTWHTLAP